jgi:ribonuclease PH
MPRTTRKPDELRPLSFQRGYTGQAPGSVLVRSGRTTVLCTCCVELTVPPWLVGKGQGWLTAEYGMLPGSTSGRKPRDKGGKVDGRSVEIQRLIGRSMRAVVDLAKLGERTLWLDCDVLQADGGTRCAAISGAWIAAHRALDRMGLSRALTDTISAVSVGVVDGTPLLDLDYSEDSNAEVDMNVAMTGDGRLVEVQATAEGEAFTRAELDALLDLAAGGIGTIAEAQREAAHAPRG